MMKEAKLPAWPRSTLIEQSDRAPLLPALLLCFIAGCALFVWLSGRGYGPLFYNSDLVHPYLLAADLLHDPRSWLSWTSPPAPFIFPDIFLASAIALLGLPPAMQPIVYGGSLFALCSMAIGLIVGEVKLGHLGRGTLTAGICLGAAILASFDAGGWGASRVAPFVLAAFIHSGAVMSYLFALWLLLKALRPHTSAAVYLSLSLLCLLATISDPIFAVWFSVPALCLCVVTLVRRSVMPALFTSASVGLPTVMGYGASKWLSFSQGEYITASGIGWRNSLRALAGEIAAAACNADLYLVATLIAMAALGVSATVLIWQPSMRGDQRSQTIVLLAGTCVCSVAAPVALGLFNGAATWRYCSILFMVLPLIGAIHSHRWIGSVRSSALFGSAAAVCFVALATTRFAEHSSASMPELAECIRPEENGTVIGDYWTAKRNIFLSDRQILVQQVGLDGMPQFWNYNDDWFEGPMPAKSIFIKGLDPSLIRNRFGEPASKKTCAGSELWTYPRGISIIDSEYLASSLPSQTGALAGTSRVATLTDAQGALTFGPYLALPKGSYRVSISYSASTRGNTWDIAVNGGRSVVAGGDLNPARNSVDFDLILNDRARALEVRTYYMGYGVLTINSISIHPSQPPVRAKPDQ